MEKRRKKGVSETATMADGNVSTNQATAISNTPHVSASIQRIVATPAETYKKEALPKTATIADDSVSTKKATAISSNTHATASTAKVAITPTNARAKVIKNLDLLAENYRYRENKVRGFITDISQILLLKKNNTASHYGTFLLPNRTLLSIRVSNHNAKVSNFDKRNEYEAISIAISHRYNQGINNDGKAHIIEFFYRKRDLENSPGKPLALIINSVKNLLLTGEYIDTTGLAEKQEVNPR